MCIPTLQSWWGYPWSLTSHSWGFSTPLRAVVLDLFMSAVHELTPISGNEPEFDGRVVHRNIWKNSQKCTGFSIVQAWPEGGKMENLFKTLTRVSADSSSHKVNRVGQATSMSPMSVPPSIAEVRSRLRIIQVRAATCEWISAMSAD